MPKILICFLFVFSKIAFGQGIESIIQQKRQQIERVEIKQSDRITYLSSNFADSQIKAINLRDKVNQLTVTKVYYVYTAYKRYSGFDQIKLDRQRFEKLKELYPSLFENPLIEWEILEQTGLEIYTEGKTYFHGFILIHKPLPSIKGREGEVDLVKSFFSDPTSGSFITEEDPIAELLLKKGADTITEIDVEEASFEGGGQAIFDFIQMHFDIPNDVWKERKDFWAKFSLVIDETGMPQLPEFKEEYSRSVKKEIMAAIAEMPLWKPKRVDGQGVSDTIHFEWRVSYTPQLKGMHLMNGQPPTMDHESNTNVKTPVQFETIGSSDIIATPVYKALGEIKKDERLAVVMDVTGSMANHIISTSFWLNEHSKDLPFTSFTAFNDGDNKKDNEKEIGETGGIYFTGFFSEFNNNIATAMQNGNGGDYPENDIEAILYAIRKDVKATGVLLLADNFSKVKDFELLNKVNKPVYVLPCGLTGSIHPNYLELVSKTEGRIYYDDRVIDIKYLKKWDTFKIRKTTYIFDGKEIKVDTRFN